MWIVAFRPDSSNQNRAKPWLYRRNPGRSRADLYKRDCFETHLAFEQRQVLNCQTCQDESHGEC